MKKNFDLFLAVILILLVTLSRNAGLAPNISLITGISLFSGFIFKGSRWAYILPMFGLLVSDYFLGFYSGMLWVYAAFAVSIYLGSLIRNPRLTTILGAAFAASFMFFLISNFGVWTGGILYPKTASGLKDCFIMALPFFRNSLISDLLSTLVIFRCYAFINSVAVNVRAKYLVNKT